ncbi:MAG: helix-turn-helix domain-containing protein [Candidatus Excrementavichristensenella sp.]|jgi:transposase-like protein
MADWDRIREAYTREGVPVSELAEQYGVGRSTLYKRIAREGWLRLTEERPRRELARAVATLSAVIRRMLEDEQQFYRHLVAVRDGKGSETQERIFHKADVRALKDVTGALKALAHLSEGMGEGEAPENVIILPNPCEEEE